MLTLNELSRRLANRQVSASSLIDQSLARIMDPRGEGARAFISVSSESARAQADEVDRRRAAEQALPVFAGIPLAFAFIATLGTIGVVTQLLTDLGWNPYDHGFTIFSKTGVELTYLYFQIPLMVLIMAPALDAMRREWREAAENLGATGRQYWRYVGLPILLPSILGTTVLLFGNAFGAHATAYALTGGGSQTSVVTILIGAQLSSDALSNPGLGNALALGMIVIMAITIAIYTWLQRLAERWK